MARKKSAKITLTPKQKAELVKCADPRHWIKEWVFTQDEHDRRNPIKKLPYYWEGKECPDCKATLFVADEVPGKSLCVWCRNGIQNWTQDDWAIRNAIDSNPERYGLMYLALVVDHHTRYKFRAVPKSRQMRLSWMKIILHLHSALFSSGRNIAFQSQKEDKAKRLINRAKIVYEHLPEWMKLPLTEDDLLTKGFTNNSRVYGIPQGSSQIEMETLSDLLSDEAAIQVEARASFGKAYPALVGGGEYDAISRAGPGFFEEICLDKEEKPEAME